MRQQITIYPDQVIGTPNPRMWGIFYEEINHAGDGGLYAELLRNRNFADANLPEDTVYADGKVHTKGGHVENFDPTDPLPGWSMTCMEGAAASMDRTRENPRNPECPEQLRLGVLRAGNGVLAVNSGYWGIPVKAQEYYGFIILRGEGMHQVKVGMMYSSGVVLCEQEIPVTEDFVKVPYRFSCPANTTNARFFIRAEEAGILYVDFVTLFPADTYLNRPYGFRRDLMEMLRGLRPGFLRFPGGCVVEGIDLANAIHWKKTRGPIEDRPGHWDLWGYRATDGLGMLEFCQLAEDLDAEIMYVVNCGMSCQFRKSELADEQGIDDWLQNALDGIEYIYGDVHTKWGAVRAADGHPEPFRLKYVEIGNENWGEDYHLRYRKFYRVIKEKYPELTLIATQMVPDAPMDMVDDHYYTPPQRFPNMWDTYEGDGIPVYVGEYACNSEVGYGNLTGAVSDATFMIRMENRCDRIRIASYAPLFCNDHDRRWPVNLINFDGSRVFGIPSYEVQRLFAQYAPENVWATDCNPRKGADSNLYVTAGEKAGNAVIKAANFGTEAIEAEFCLNGKEVHTAEGWLLASESGKDTNTLLDPAMVSAVKVPVSVKNGKVIFRFPANSFGVILVK
ncbi:MAG: alpha-L-arabinofuranosidase C-terminal domain-containing protein [Candidatus Merdivicinus sp.]|jgi:alpha-N-arabinofuranosidase